MRFVLIVSYATSMYVCVLHRPKAIDIDKLIDRYRHRFLYLCLLCLAWRLIMMSRLSYFCYIWLLSFHCFQYCLSGHPTLPCNVLKFKSTTIMLDCGLDTTSVLNFLPLPLVHRWVTIISTGVFYLSIHWVMCVSVATCFCFCSSSAQDSPSCLVGSLRMEL